MRICIFFHCFDGGGAERTTISLANELFRRGHEVVIAVRFDKGPLRHTLNQKITVYNMNLPEKGKLIKNIKNVQKLVQIMNSTEYNLIMAVMSEMAQVAAFAHAFSNKKTPLVCVLHNTMSVEKTSFQFLRHSLFGFFDKHYSKVIAVSEAVRQDYLQSCQTDKDKVVTIYNPVVDEKLYRLSKQQPKHPWLCKERKFYTLLLVGRLTRQKNHSMMFSVLQKLREEGDFRLILLGDGELKDELKQETKEKGISEWVDFAGFVDNPYSFMASCDCLVLCSFYEGLPTVLIEAMACGCRIVSVDCPSGPREILDHGKYGTIVKMNDVDMFKNGVLHAVQSKPQKEILIKKSMDFSVSKAATEYENIFKIVKNKGGIRRDLSQDKIDRG